MSRRRRCCFIGLVIITPWLMTACGDDPPNKELQQAQQAIDAARDAGADRYAKDEFTASQDAIKRAQAAVAARDYRQALNDALDARDRAQTASRNTVDNKAKAKSDAERVLRDSALTIVDARAKLRAAESSRRPLKAVSSLRHDIVDAETHVQEARTAFDNGDYLKATEGLLAPMARLSESLLAVESGGPAARTKNLPPSRGK